MLVDGIGATIYTLEDFVYGIQVKILVDGFRDKYLDRPQFKNEKFVCNRSPPNTINSRFYQTDLLIKF